MAQGVVYEHAQKDGDDSGGSGLCAVAAAFYPSSGAGAASSALGAGNAHNGSYASDA
jgi:hypothetical protein